MFNLNIRPSDFLNYYTVDKKIVQKQKSINLEKLKRFGNLGGDLVNPLLLRFLTHDNIAIRWACEGDTTATTYKMKIPHIGFIVDVKGANQLLKYLDRCRDRYAPESEYWNVSFHQGRYNEEDLVPMVSWSLSTFLYRNKRELLFKTMCEEFDAFFLLN